MAVKSLSFRSIFLTPILALLFAGTVACGGAEDEPEAIAPSESPRLLVDYQYGDAIARSQLRVYSDGAVMRTEVVCCPSRVEPVIERQLSPAALAELEESIMLARVGTLHVEADDLADSPSKEGELVAFAADGDKVTIRSVARDPYRFAVNDAPESTKIVELVNGLARQKLPR